MGILVLSEVFNVFVTGASTPRTGPQAEFIYALRLPAGTCHPNTADFPAAQCLADGDTLPVGQPFKIFVGSVFDTGASIVLVTT